MNPHTYMVARYMAWRVLPVRLRRKRTMTKRELSGTDRRADVFEIAFGVLVGGLMIGMVVTFVLALAGVR